MKSKKNNQKKENINLLYFNKSEAKTINKKRIVGIAILAVVIQKWQLGYLKSINIKL